MSTDTPIEVFKQEVDDAIKDAHTTIDNVAKRLEVYLAKLQEQNTVVAPEPLSPDNAPTPATAPEVAPSLPTPGSTVSPTV